MSDRPGPDDHSTRHRANCVRNLGRIDAAIRKAHEDHEQIKAHMRQRRDELNREIADLQAELATDMAWDEDDRQELETLLKERRDLDVFLAGGDG